MFGWGANKGILMKTKDFDRHTAAGFKESLLVINAERK